MHLRQKSIRSIARTVLLLLVCVLAPFGCKKDFIKSIRPGPQNLIVITIDTLRPDYLGAYGKQQARTPVIDHLASRSLRFTNATTSLPRTTPAISSLFTGLWPKNHGSREVRKSMHRVPTLAAILRRKGYVTAGVSSTRALSKMTRSDTGFKDFLNEPMGAERVTNGALELAAQQSADKPLFLWAHYFDPHFPYFPPRTTSKNALSDPCRELTHRISQREITKGLLTRDYNGIAQSTVKMCQKLYQGEISFTDSQLGRLFDGLRKLGRLKNAIIVLTSDHGEHFGERGIYYEHGPFAHDAVLKIPLLISAGDVPSGVSDQLIQLEDLMPTLLSLLDVSKSTWPKMDGIDLSQSIRGEGGVQREFSFSESASELYIHNTRSFFSGRRHGRRCFNSTRFSICGLREDALTLHDHTKDPYLKLDISSKHLDVKSRLREAWYHWNPEEARERAARNKRFKLIEMPQEKGGYRTELYDLQADPEEKRNVLSEHPDVARTLQTELDAWTKDITKRSNRRPRNKEELNTLRSLGYL